MATQCQALLDFIQAPTNGPNYLRCKYHVEAWLQPLPAETDNGQFQKTAATNRGLAK